MTKKSMLFYLVMIYIPNTSRTIFPISCFLLVILQKSLIINIFKIKLLLLTLLSVESSITFQNVFCFVLFFFLEIARFHFLASFTDMCGHVTESCPMEYR